MSILKISHTETSVIQNEASVIDIRSSSLNKFTVCVSNKDMTFGLSCLFQGSNSTLLVIIAKRVD